MDLKSSTAAAWACGGILWLVAGLINGGSYEALWLVADALILVGLLGLGRLRLHGTSRSGQAGLALATVGRLVFIAGEVVSVVQGNDENLLLPLAALSSAIGLTVYGVGTARAALVDAGPRFAPLLVGLYPFLAMFPIVIARGGDPSELAIAFWGIPIALLGGALAISDVRSPR